MMVAIPGFLDERDVASVHVYVEDVDRGYSRALDHSATSLSEPRDQPYGDRTAGGQDAQGNCRWIGTRLRGKRGGADDMFGGYLQVAVTVHVLLPGARALVSLACTVQSLSLGASFIFQLESAEAMR